MEKSFLLLLCVLAFLFTVFTYMFLSKHIKYEQDRYKKTTTKLRDSITLVKNKLSDADYFSLQNN